MARKCSHCGNIGHNTRTCTTHKARSTTSTHLGGGGVRLFGVQLGSLSSNSSSSCCNSSNNNVSIMKKSFSMDSILSVSSTPTCSSSLSNIDQEYGYGGGGGGGGGPHPHNSNKVISHSQSHGYLSDGLINNSPTTHDRKRKGVPWTEEEHRIFLQGLEKLGKGDWRGISKNFVTTRTPTQVASHAQKYFLRKSNFLNKSKRRPSLFDDHVKNKKINEPSNSCGFGYKNKILERDDDLKTLPIWIYTSFDSQCTTTSSSNIMSHHHEPIRVVENSQMADLELTLAAPSPRSLLNQSEPSPPTTTTTTTSLLVGSITVV